MAAVKTKIGNLIFDAVFKVDHTSKTTITAHSVEKGADISDHAYMEPNEVSMEIGMSDVVLQLGGRSGGSRSVSAYAAIQELQRNLQPLTVVTRLKTYKNMMIENVVSSDDFTTMHGMRATINLVEVPVVDTRTVRVGPRQGTANLGAKQPVDASAKQSVLKQASDLLGV